MEAMEKKKSRKHLKMYTNMPIQTDSLLYLVYIQAVQFTTNDHMCSELMACQHNCISIFYNLDQFAQHKNLQIKSSDSTTLK